MESHHIPDLADSVPPLPNLQLRPTSSYLLCDIQLGLCLSPMIKTYPQAHQIFLFCQF